MRPDLVPAGSVVSSDYEEAIRCLQADASKGAAVLARRAVETASNYMLRGQDKIPSKLFAKIDLLQKQGELTVRLAALAHKVRVFGNSGAHGGDDGLDNVTREEAEQALDFLEHLLQHVFIIGEGGAPERDE